MKKIFFLVGIPRAGNTLLSSILNQNPDIAVTPNSIVPDILSNTLKLKDTDIFKNYPDHKSFNNIAHHVFDLYYKDWDFKYIIDRSCWGTPGNLKILKEILKDIKIIVLVRDIIEVLGSFIRWSHNRSDTFISKYNVQTIEERCDRLMKDDIIIKNLMAIKNLLGPEHRDLCHLVEYNDLVSNPKKTIREIYNYLKIPEFKHRYINLSQFEVNGIKYDDTVFGKELHTIKTNNINKSNYDVHSLIPKSIIEKYRLLNFWTPR